MRIGGRQKGTPNKKTLALVEILEAKKIDPVSGLSTLLPILEPEKQADVYLKLMEYLYPKRKAIEMSLDEQTQEAFKPSFEQMKELVRIARKESSNDV